MVWFPACSGTGIGGGEAGAEGSLAEPQTCGGAGGVGRGGEASSGFPGTVGLRVSAVPVEPCEQLSVGQSSLPAIM